MSRFDWSAWSRPLVTSGIATTPPVPVVAATPEPVRRNQVSRVKVESFRAAASPRLAYSLTPLKYKPPTPAGGVTV